MAARGEFVNLDALLRDIKERDHRDGGRDLAPMAPADDAVLLDTTRLTLDEVVDRMEAEVRHRIS